MSTVYITPSNAHHRRSSPIISSHLAYNFCSSCCRLWYQHLKLTQCHSYLGPWGNLGMPTPSKQSTYTDNPFLPTACGTLTEISNCPQSIITLPLTESSTPTGSQTQKGITTYSLSANRQKPLAGALNAAIFNSWRRFRGQALYVIPPFVAAYLLLEWADKK